jgi:Chaperone of endosialidase
MSDTLPERPTFTSGQYIGAADLNATVDYARDETRRLALSASTWGIATGLALVEVLDATGGVQMFIEPGIAWDGYGRPVVVLSPAPVTPDLFASLLGGNQPVWLRYSAAGTQAIAPGFQTCGAGDPPTRVLETYAIEAGPQSDAQQTAGVVLNGVTVPDPRNMLIAFNAAAAVVLDGSAPQQVFPDDSAEWLIPIGIVSYVAGSPGSFSPRSALQLALNRVARCYMGAVAESVLAADGVLRLRDRQTDQQAGKTNDDLANAASIQVTDVQIDPNNPTRVVGNELVWVEGNMRVIGDARLWGGQLSLRKLDGSEPAGSLFLRRNADASTPTNQNLEVSIGLSPTGPTDVNRLLVAASQPATATTLATLASPPALSVGTDSRVGIGVEVPETGLALDINGDFGHDGGPTTVHLNGSTVGDTKGTLLLTASGSTIELGADGVFTHVTIGTSSPQADTALDVHGGGIALNKPANSTAIYSTAFLRLLGSELIDQDDGKLHIRSGGNIVTFDGHDNVGVGTTSPAKLLDVNGDANVAGTLAAGSVSAASAAISGNANITGNLNVGGGITITPSPNTHATLQLWGSQVFDDDQGVLHLQSGGAGGVVAFDATNAMVGIGTKTPAAQLDVAGNLNVGGGITIKPQQTGNATLTLWGSQVFDDDQGVLHLQSGGAGGVVAFDATNAMVGIGTNTPTAALEVAGDVVVTGIVYASTYVYTSDARLKRDIQPLEGALEKLLALRGVEFEWTREDLARLSPGRQPGLIAQEVETVFPTWVRDDPRSGMKLLGPQGFEALVVEALRQLANRVEALEKENSRLGQLLAADAGGKAKSAKSGEKPGPKGVGGEVQLAKDPVKSGRSE